MPKVLNKYKDTITKNDIYVGRPSDFGNPFTIGEDGDRADVVEKFEEYTTERLMIEPDWLKPLRGKNLVCFCKPLACHADILVRLANKD